MSMKADQKLHKANKKMKELEKNLAATESSSKKFEKMYQELKHLANLEKRYQALDEQCTQLMVCPQLSFSPTFTLSLTICMLLKH